VVEMEGSVEIGATITTSIAKTGAMKVTKGASVKVGELLTAKHRRV
jgi:hypothetical protein